MPKYLEDVPMERLSIRVPKATLDEIERHVLTTGMYRSYFFSAAFILGARTLARVFSANDVASRGSSDLDELREALKHETVRSSYTR